MAIAEKVLTVKANRAALEGAMATTPEGEQVPVPAEILAKAQSVIDSYTSTMMAKVTDHIERRAQGIGEEQSGPYNAFDLAVLSPIQFVSNPPYQPHKIIAGGEFTFVLGYIWTNPTVDIAHGFLNPASQQLSWRPYRVRFEQIDLTNVVNGPDHTVTGTFGGPAASLTPVWWFFVAPTPGVNPRLMELNVTADVTVGAMPWAAFATNFYDVDSDLGFGLPFLPAMPSTGPGWRNGQPLRYLVYTK